MTSYCTQPIFCVFEESIKYSTLRGLNIKIENQCPHRKHAIHVAHIPIYNKNIKINKMVKRSTHAGRLHTYIAIAIARKFKVKYRKKWKKRLVVRLFFLQYTHRIDCILQLVSVIQVYTSRIRCRIEIVQCVCCQCLQFIFHIY